MRFASKLLVMLVVSPAWWPLLAFSDDFFASPAATLFEHPATSNKFEKANSRWRQGAGNWGESFADARLRLRGFEVFEVKNGSNQGIDRIAIKRNALGKIIDVRIVEVKTHRGNGRAKLAKTNHGEQLGRDWLAKKFRQMRASPDPNTKRLAAEISAFRRSIGRSALSMAELHDINTRTGQYTVRRPGTDGNLSHDSIERHLDRIKHGSRDPNARRWASNSGRKIKLIRGMNERTWLVGGKRPALARSGAVRRSVQAATSRCTKRALARLAGPIGATIALSMDASEIYGNWRQFENGQISEERFVRTLSSSVGGMAGATAGAWSGATIGGQVGAFGGPAVGFTVPAGLVIGGGIGGTVGYFVGDKLATVGVDSWYGNLSENVQSDLDEWLVATNPRG